MDFDLINIYLYAKITVLHFYTSNTSNTLKAYTDFSHACITVFKGQEENVIIQFINNGKTAI